MPSFSTPPDDWIHFVGKPARIDVLAAGEVEPLLAWLFGDLGRKVKPLALRETASVVRYLMWLAIAGVPKEIGNRGSKALDRYWRYARYDKRDVARRNEAEVFAKLVWEDLLQSGTFKTSSKGKAKTFLRENSGRWHHPWLQSALELLETFEVPSGAAMPFAPKTTRARGVAKSNNNAQADSDLSERIAAADAILQTAVGRKRRRLIADALNDSPLAARAKDTWGPNEVRDRVRAYQRLTSRNSPQILASTWIVRFRSHVSIKA
jgi:hypothetical protein